MGSRGQSNYLSLSEEDKQRSLLPSAGNSNKGERKHGSSQKPVGEPPKCYVWLAGAVTVLMVASILVLALYRRPDVQQIQGDKTLGVEVAPLQYVHSHGSLVNLVTEHIESVGDPGFSALDDLCKSLASRTEQTNILTGKGKTLSLYTENDMLINFAWQASWPLRKDGDDPAAFAWASRALACVTTGALTTLGQVEIKGIPINMHARGHVSIMFPKKGYLLKKVRNLTPWLASLGSGSSGAVQLEDDDFSFSSNGQFGLIENTADVDEEIEQEKQDPEERTMDLVGVFAKHQHPRRFVLHGPYIDTTFLRNAFSFHLYRSVGGWAPHTEHVNINLNHDATLGMYVLMEKIDEQSLGIRRATRHCLAKHKKCKHFEALIKFDWGKDDGKHMSFAMDNSNSTVVIQYPQLPGYLNGRPNVVENAFATQTEAAMQRIDQVVSANQVGELSSVIDVPSFVRFFLVEEIAKDMDGYGLSAFARLELGRDEKDHLPSAALHTKLVHGSVWDFHLGYGFACMPMYFQNYITGETDVGVRGWNIENLRTNALWTDQYGHPNGGLKSFGRNLRQFFLNMWNHPDFRPLFRTSWLAARGYYSPQDGSAGVEVQELARTTPLTWEKIDGWLAGMGNILEDRAAADMALWSNTTRGAFFSVCHPENNRNFPNALSNLREFVRRRVHWIDMQVMREVLADERASAADLAAAGNAEKAIALETRHLEL